MFISPEAHSVFCRSEVRKNDILITITGNVGRVIYVENLDIANINQHIERIRIENREVDPKYIYNFLNQPEIRKNYNKITTGLAYPQISLRQVRDTKVALPPHPEQRAIAAVLGGVDELIGALDALIAKKRDIKQAAMQQLLTGETRLPGFEGDWDNVALGTIGSFAKGAGIRREQVRREGLPCVRYGEIYTHHDDIVRAFNSYIDPEVAQGSYRLKTGDLLFAGSGETAEEIGKCVAYLGDEEAYAGGDIVVFSPRDENSSFLGYLMNSPWIAVQKTRMGQGDAVVHIGARHLAQISFKRPEKAEQTAIAAVLTDMDAEIAALELRRYKTRALKQGMMKELLTGRTRLVPAGAAHA